MIQTLDLILLLEILLILLICYYNLIALNNLRLR